jgi:hypothetical protein
MPLRLVAKDGLFWSLKNLVEAVKGFGLHKLDTHDKLDITLARQVKPGSLVLGRHDLGTSSGHCRPDCRGSRIEGLRRSETIATINVEGGQHANEHVVGQG